MSLFKGTKAKAKLNPRTKESKFGGSFLMNDLNWGLNPNLPTRQIEGMTGREQDIQGNIYDQAMDGGRGYNLAMDHAQKTLQGGYDPRTSDYYKGYKNEVNSLRDDSNQRMGRQAQIGGMTGSTPSQGVGAENNRRYDDMIMREIGMLYDRERGRQDQAAGAASQLDQQKMNQQMQADQAMVKERVIQQMQQDEIYKRAYQQLMFQYDVLAPMAQGMMNYSPGTYMQPGGPSDWDIGMGVTTDVMGVMSGAQALKKGGSNTSTNSSGGGNPNGGDMGPLPW
jgi:hypothetical protein